MMPNFLKIYWLFLTIVLILMPCAVYAANCNGCVQLDTLSFEKVVSKFQVSLVKFDVAFPYGDKHDQFCKLSEALSTNANILVAEVGVKDYGDKENVALAEKYKIVKEDYPVLLVFMEGKPEPIRYEGDFKNEVMQRFVRSTTGLWIGLPGCLEPFDALAQRFASTDSSDNRKVILREAEDSWDKVSLTSERKSAEIYVKVMRRMMDNKNPSDYISSELNRVEGLRQGKLTKDKKDEMERRLNILQSFLPNKKDKSEL